MKTHNKRVLEANKMIIQSTRKASQDIIQASMKVVNKLTHPHKKIARVGSVVGGIIGVGLVLTGLVLLMLRYNLWASGFFIAGVATIASNIANLKKNKA